MAGIWSPSRPRPWSSACKNPSASHPCLPLSASRDLDSFSPNAGGTLGAKSNQGGLLSPSPHLCAWICSKCLALLPWAQGRGPALLCMYKSLPGFPGRAFRLGFRRKWAGCDSGDLSWPANSSPPGGFGPVVVPREEIPKLGSFLGRRWVDRDSPASLRDTKSADLPLDSRESTLQVGKVGNEV